MEQEAERKIAHVLKEYQRDKDGPITIDVYCQRIKEKRKITINYINRERMFDESVCLDPSSAHASVRMLCQGYIDLTPKLNTLIYCGEEGKEHEYQLEQTNSKRQLVSQLCVHNMSLYHIQNFGKTKVLKNPNGIYASQREYRSVYDEMNSENQFILSRFPNGDPYMNRIFEFYHRFSLIELQQYAFSVFQGVLERQKGEPLTLSELEELQMKITIKYANSDKLYLIKQILKVLDPQMIAPGMTHQIKKQFVKRQQA